jgi:hypothetical protein
VGYGWLGHVLAGANTGFLLFQGCQGNPVGIVEVKGTWFRIESDFGGAELRLTKVTRHRVVCHSFGVKCSYKIVRDRMNRQPLQMEIEDN